MTLDYHIQSRRSNVLYKLAIAIEECLETETVTRQEILDTVAEVFEEADDEAIAL